ETSVAATYVWPTVTTSSATGGSYVRERSAGATATFAFTGSSITWLTVTGPDQGKASVAIDGVSKGTFDQYASATHYQVARTISGLSSGAHTLKITILGLKNSSATNTFVSIDALRIGSN